MTQGPYFATTPTPEWAATRPLVFVRMNPPGYEENAGVPDSARLKQIVIANCALSHIPLAEQYDNAAAIAEAMNRIFYGVSDGTIKR